MVNEPRAATRRLVTPKLPSTNGSKTPGPSIVRDAFENRTPTPVTWPATPAVSSTTRSAAASSSPGVPTHRWQGRAGTEAGARTTIDAVGLGVFGLEVPEQDRPTTGIRNASRGVGRTARTYGR